MGRLCRSLRGRMPGCAARGDDNRWRLRILVYPAPKVVPIVATLFRVEDTFSGTAFSFNFVVVGQRFFFRTGLALRFTSTVFRHLLVEVPVS